MRRQLAALVLALVLPLPALAAEVVIQPGETLSEIAARAGISTQRLMQINGLRDADRIVAGQRLTVPGGHQNTGGGNREGSAAGGRITVRQGETLSEIAERYGVSVERLMQLNGISDPTRLVAGDRLILRQTSSNRRDGGGGGTRRDGGTTVTVRPGDTLSDIADRYNVTIERLVQLNRLQNPSQVMAGEKLLISTRPATRAQRSDTSGQSTAGARTHVVQPGETLSDIATDYKVPMERLVSLNNLKDPDDLMAGTRLRLIPPPPVPRSTPRTAARPKPRVTTPTVARSTPARSTTTTASTPTRSAGTTTTTATSVTRRTTPATVAGAATNPTRTGTPAANGTTAATTATAATPTTTTTVATGTPAATAGVAATTTTVSDGTAQARSTSTTAATTPTTTATVRTASTSSKEAGKSATPATSAAATPAATTMTTTSTTAAASTTARSTATATTAAAATAATTVASTATTTASTTRTADTTTVATASQRPASTATATAPRSTTRTRAVAADWRTYGPMQVDWSSWQTMGGSYVAPVLTSNGQPFYLAINCGARKLNTTGASGQWKTWDAPQTEFEQSLVTDLCRLKGG